MLKQFAFIASAHAFRKGMRIPLDLLEKWPFARDEASSTAARFYAYILFFNYDSNRSSKSCKNNLVYVDVFIQVMVS